MMKMVRKLYTLEFKVQAVSRVSTEHDISPVARDVGVDPKTLRKWWKMSQDGALEGAGSKRVSPEQMELSRLRAENLRLKRENQILKKAAAYFAKDTL